MKVELNLDTEEKKALFLILFNRPVELEGFIKNLLDCSGSKPTWQSTLSILSHRRCDFLIDLIDQVFPFEDWEKLHDALIKEGSL